MPTLHHRATTLALTLPLLMLAACGEQVPQASAATRADSAVVLGAQDVARATRVPFAAGVTVTGSLDPAQRVDIKAHLSGQVERVLVDRGVAVAHGQLLATYQAAALRSRAASAEAALASRERDLESADTLFQAGVFSERDHILARVARDAAQADLAQAREALGFAFVRAPFRGEISERVVNTGEVVQPGARLFVLANSDTLELAGQVNADQIASVRVGQAVQVTLEAYPGRTFAGTVARVEPVASADTRRVGVYVRVPNVRPRIVAGLFARGTILASDKAATTALTVPSVAVVVDQASASVFVVDGHRVERRPVVIGGRDEATGLVEVRSGINEGNTVLVAPGKAPPQGTIVRIATSDASQR